MPRMPSTAARPTGRRAAAAVEFAFIAPIMVTLVIGMVECSRGLEIKDTLNDAARKGCRTGIRPGKANADVTSDVNDILTDAGLDKTQATITIQVNGATAEVNTAKQNDKITVKVSMPVTATRWMGSYFIPGSSVESETIVMMKQG